MIDSDLQEAAAILATGADRLGISLDAQKLERYSRYCMMIHETNQHMNLTGLHTLHDVARGLILDSLTLVPALPAKLSKDSRPLRMIDVGSGAGIPGIPIAILFPSWKVALVESVHKKARFLDEVVTELGLLKVQTEARRSEDLTRLPAYRDAADLCVARAVASLPSLIELCAPFVRAGGYLLFPKSGNIRDEIATATEAMRLLRVRLESVVPVSPELGLGHGRCVLVLAKTAPSPRAFPRRVGVARSHPL